MVGRKALDMGLGITKAMLRREVAAIGKGMKYNTMLRGPEPSFCGTKQVEDALMDLHLGATTAIDPRRAQLPALPCAIMPLGAQYGIVPSRLGAPGGMARYAITLASLPCDSR